ncbi:MAG: DUF5688 family protein [Oribacterium sp.]|nr:DUF5688 family protein [Oribacterium sp.]
MTTKDSNSDIQISDEQYSKLLGQVRIGLVPTANHQELLKNAAHLEVEDLSMIVHAIAPQSDGTTKHLLVTDIGLEAMGIDRNIFLQDAIAASERNYPGSIEQLSSFLVGRDDGAASMLFVASMPDMSNGAGVIMYPDFMDKAAKELGGDFYVLPSSIHEVLLLRDDGVVSLEDLKDIVRTVNRMEVAPDERLSDNVYHFDAAERKLEIGEKYQERKQHEKESRHSVLGELSSKKTAVKSPVERATRKKDEMTI